MSSDNLNIITTESMEHSVSSEQDKATNIVENDKAIVDHNYLIHFENTNSIGPNNQNDNIPEIQKEGYVDKPCKNKEHTSNVSGNSDGLIHVDQKCAFEYLRETSVCDNKTKDSLNTESSVLEATDCVEQRVEDEIIQDSLDKLNISGECVRNRSEVIINNASESLRNILAYNSSSDDDDSDEAIKITSDKPWRKNNKDSSSSSDSESDSSQASLSSDSDSDSESDSASVIIASDDGLRNASLGSNEINKGTGAVKKVTRAGYDQQEFMYPIPDISKLSINVEKEEFLHIGRIGAIISEIVTVTAIPGTPAFDIDTLLFIENESNGKKPLGPIFDVLGPVSEPMYCVRFNTTEDLEKANVKGGMKVFAAPKNDCTKFVFLKELLKMRGSDASWLNDQEQPPEMAEFSDDEKEREARRVNKKGNMKRKFDESNDKHKRYEKMMNQCNILNTRVSKLMDAHKNLSRQVRPNDSSLLLPSFDPSIPPPGFAASNQFPFPLRANQLVFAHQAYMFNQPSAPSSAPATMGLWGWQDVRSPPPGNPGSDRSSSTNF